MNSMDIQEILEHLPHRYPFLLVDRVLSMVPGESIVAIKNVSINEPFFPGHFPHYPVMPGVLIVEALAQAGAILSFKSMGAKAANNILCYFAGIDNVRFKKPVTPGDQLVLKVKIERSMRSLWKYSGQALVDDTVVATADMMSAFKITDSAPQEAGQ